MFKFTNVSTIASVSALATASLAQGYYVTNSGACFTQTVYAGSTFMCPDRSFISAVGDYYDPRGRVDTVTCCRLNAGPFAVELIPAPMQTRWVSAYSKTTCTGHRAMRGIGFNYGGAPTAIHCAEMSAASRYIYRDDPYYTTDYVINPYSYTQCGYNEVAMGVGDIFSPDGDTDAFHCGRMYMP